jgi:hypothetical protein
MKTILILLVAMFNSFCIFSQNKIALETSFKIHGKEKHNVKYYVLEKNIGYPIQQTGNKILLDSSLVKSNTLRLLAVYNKKKIQFPIDTEIYYLKIRIASLKIRRKFKEKYLIQQGLEYDFLVRRSRKKYNLK